MMERLDEFKRLNPVQSLYLDLLRNDIELLMKTDPAYHKEEDFQRVYAAVIGEHLKKGKRLIVDANDDERVALLREGIPRYFRAAGTFMEGNKNHMIQRNGLNRGERLFVEEYLPILVSSCRPYLPTFEPFRRLKTISSQLTSRNGEAIRSVYRQAIKEMNDLLSPLYVAQLGFDDFRLILEFCDEIDFHHLEEYQGSGIYRVVHAVGGITPVSVARVVLGSIVSRPDFRQELKAWLNQVSPRGKVREEVLGLGLMAATRQGGQALVNFIQLGMQSPHFRTQTIQSDGFADYVRDELSRVPFETLDAVLRVVINGLQTDGRESVERFCALVHPHLGYERNFMAATLSAPDQPKPTTLLATLLDAFSVQARERISRLPASAKACLYLLSIGGTVPQEVLYRSLLDQRWSRSVEPALNDIIGFMEVLKPNLMRKLSQKGEDPEVAYGLYTSALYLQVFWIRSGSPRRFTENEFGKENNDSAAHGWERFAADITPRSPEKGLRLPGRSLKLLDRDVKDARPDPEVRQTGLFLDLFDVIQKLPIDYTAAVSQVTLSLPPSAYRNYLLYLLFVDRILHRQMNASMSPDLAAAFDFFEGKSKYSPGSGYGDPYFRTRAAIRNLFSFNEMKNIVDALPEENRKNVLVSLSQIAGYLVWDNAVLKENKEKVIAEVAKAATSPGVSDYAYLQERKNYLESLYWAPGGPESQLVGLVGMLLESELNRIMVSDVSFSEKRKAVVGAFPAQATPYRDKYLKILLDEHGQGATPQEIGEVAALFSNPSLTEIYSLKALERHHGRHFSDFGDLDLALATVRGFFPQSSPMRDDVLVQIGNELAGTSKEYGKVRSLLSDPTQNWERLQESEGAQEVFGLDQFRAIVKSLAPYQKAEFLLWLMRISPNLPQPLMYLEYRLHIKFDAMRELLFDKPGQYFKEAGARRRRDTLEPFLYGEKGLFSNETVMNDFLSEFYGAIMPRSLDSQWDVMRKIFLSVFRKADPFRRENALLALMENMADLNPTEQTAPESAALSDVVVPIGQGNATTRRRSSGQKSQAIVHTREQSRAITIFLGSFGLVGTKIAQFLAELPNCPPEWRVELRLLKDRGRPLDKGVVLDMADKLFLGSGFDYRDILQPEGVGSVAAVYEGHLTNGHDVALKFKKPDADRLIASDFSFLDVIYAELSPILQDAGMQLPRDMVPRVQRMIRDELDFARELENQKRLSANLTVRGNSKQGIRIVVPVTKAVIDNSLLIQEFVHGVPLTDEEGIRKLGADPDRIKAALAEELFEEIFLDGFFHADLHAGNVIVKLNGDVAIIDLGAAEALSESTRMLIRSLLIGFIAGSAQNVRTALEQGFTGTLLPRGLSGMIRETMSAQASPVEKVFRLLSKMEQGGATLPSEIVPLYLALGKAQYLFAHLPNATKVRIALDLTRHLGWIAKLRLAIDAYLSGHGESEQADIFEAVPSAPSAQKFKSKVGPGIYFGLVAAWETFFQAKLTDGLAGWIKLDPSLSVALAVVLGAMIFFALHPIVRWLARAKKNGLTVRALAAEFRADFQAIRFNPLHSRLAATLLFTALLSIGYAVPSLQVQVIITMFAAHWTWDYQSEMSKDVEWLAEIGTALAKKDVNGLLSPSRPLGVGSRYDHANPDTAILSNINRWIARPEFRTKLTNAVKMKLERSNHPISEQQAEEITEVLLAYVLAASKGIDSNLVEEAAFVFQSGEDDAILEKIATMASLIQYGGTTGAKQTLFVDETTNASVQAALISLSHWGWGIRATIISRKAASYFEIQPLIGNAAVLVHSAGFNPAGAPTNMKQVNFEDEFLAPLRKLRLSDMINVFRAALIAA
jgi:hypothetical protein